MATKPATGISASTMIRVRTENEQSGRVMRRSGLDRAGMDGRDSENGRRREIIRSRRSGKGWGARSPHHETAKWLIL
ncbi:MAG: hypothetical protein P8Y71_04790 [Pseudolabrys sp.]